MTSEPALVVIYGSREKAEYWAKTVKGQPVVMAYLFDYDKDLAMRDIVHWIQEKKDRFIYMIRPLPGVVVGQIRPDQITLNLNLPQDEDRLRQLLLEYSPTSTARRKKLN